MHKAHKYTNFLAIFAQNMRKTILLFITVLLSLSAGAQQRVRFALDTQYLFDNHEFEASGGQIIPSETFHFIKISPYLSWNISESADWTHKIYAGVDLIKDAGSTVPVKTTLREVPLFCTSTYEDQGVLFSSTFGIYPRRLVEGWYSELILSEETRQSDFNLEGTLLKFREGNFFAELGLDWMGNTAMTPRSASRFSQRAAGAWANCSLSAGAAASTIMQAAHLHREWWITISYNPMPSSIFPLYFRPSGFSSAPAHSTATRMTG